MLLYRNDGEENDGFYGCLIYDIPVNTTISYQISAEDNHGNNSILPFEAIIIQVLESTQNKLFINEFLASNDNIIADEYGEYDDWIEIFNGDEEAVWLGDKYLSDNFDNPDKWLLPDITLDPGDFILIWADNDPEQGDHHTNYKLDKDGEEIGLFDSENTGFFILDSLSYGLQSTDISSGLETDGGNNWIFFDKPTPGVSNLESDINEIHYQENNLVVFPNPIRQGQLNLNKIADISIYNFVGQLLFSKKKTKFCNINFLPDGIYLLVSGNGEKTKFIKN